jgi:AAA+ superfamily predicted ATPase
MASALRIPFAPSEAVLSAHQVLVTERVMALLRLRTLERRAADGVALDRQVAHWNDLGVRLAHLRSSARLPFDEVCDGLGLSGVDREALLVAAAPHLDDRVRAAIRELRGDASRAYVDGALVLDLFCPTTAERLEAGRRLHRDGSLVRAGMIEVRPPRLGHAPSPLEHELVPTPRLLGLLRGEVAMDPRVEDVARLLEVSPRDADGVATVEPLATIAPIFLANVGPPMERAPARIIVRGAAGLGRTRVAMALAACAEFAYVLEVDALLLPRNPDDLAAKLRLLEHEARVLNAFLLVRCAGVEGDRLRLLIQLVDRLENGLGWIVDKEDDLVARRHQTIDVRRPSRESRVAAWSAELAGLDVSATAEEIAFLASEFPAARGQIGQATALARAMAVDGEPLTIGLLEQAARVQLTGQLHRFATRGTSTVRTRDLVLPEEIAESIADLVAAARHLPALRQKWGARPLARGLAALFNGPPGTGKTISANAIANDLGLPLYRVDVSTLVDRYVGETEKRLTRLFEEASADHALLLFDEADSLFSKRVEVKDSTDRYSNMQVNLLLNLIEDYEGLVILTTNLKGSMDQALMRRLAFKMEFPAPEVDERIALWRSHLVDRVVVDEDIDLERLANDFVIAGGEIRNAVLRAALLAGPEPVTDALLRRAIRAERLATGNVVGAD